MMNDLLCLVYLYFRIFILIVFIRWSRNLIPVSTPYTGYFGLFTLAVGLNISCKHFVEMKSHVKIAVWILIQENLLIVTVLIVTKQGQVIKEEIIFIP